MSDSINKLIEQAKNGNIEALTTLINTKLKPKGIIAKTSIKSQSLNIMLESKSTLPQKPLVEFLHNLLQNFQHESWLSVRVYCKKSGEDIPDWVEVFTIRSDSEEELKKLASQGDIKAIKKLLDNKFKDSKFSFKISIKENKINILFEGEDVGDEDQLSELIKSDINSYQIKEIDHVKIYAKKIGEDFPEWQKDIVLEPVLIFIESQSGKNVEQAKSIDGIEFSNKIYETLDINCYKHLVQKVNLEDNKTIHEIAEDFVEDMEKFLEKDLEQTYKEIIKVFEQFNLNLTKPLCTESAEV